MQFDNSDEGLSHFLAPLCSKIFINLHLSPTSKSFPSREPLCHFLSAQLFVSRFQLLNEVEVLKTLFSEIATLMEEHSRLWLVFCQLYVLLNMVVFVDVLVAHFQVVVQVLLGDLEFYHCCRVHQLCFLSGVWNWLNRHLAYGLEGGPGEVPTAV